MALIPTPVLIAQLRQIFIDTEKTIWDGKVSEGNFEAEPEIKTNAAADLFSARAAQAVDAWLLAVKLVAIPGAINTIGSPTNHANVAPAEISKF